jgi:hypothetical protein
MRLSHWGTEIEPGFGILISLDLIGVENDQATPPWAINRHPTIANELCWLRKLKACTKPRSRTKPSPMTPGPPSALGSLLHFETRNVAAGSLVIDIDLNAGFRGERCVLFARPAGPAV